MPETLTNPEARSEKMERYRNEQTVNPDLEKKILKKVSDTEQYSDVIFCPKGSCGNPVEVEVDKEKIQLFCGMCGWEKSLVRINNEDHYRS